MRWFVFGSAALVVALALGMAGRQQQVSIRVGQSITAQVPTNLLNVRVTSSNPGIVRVRFANDRVIATGMNVGKARITVRAERVRYLTGITEKPEKVSPHRNSSTPLAEYFDFEQEFDFTVSGPGGAGSASGTANNQPFPSVEANDYLVVHKGKTLSAMLPGGSSGVRASSDSSGIASVSVRDGRVSITGVSAGRAVITVSGEITRFLAGFSDSGSLGDTYPFRSTYLVEVTEDEAKENAKPKRSGEAPKTVPIYQVCVLSKRGISIPRDINPVVFVPASNDLFDAVQDGQRIVITPKGSKTGRLSLTVQENKPRINKPYYREKVEIEVVPCDLSGEWIGGGGFQMVQEGGKLTASFRDGRTFAGTLDGRHVKLSFTYKSLAQTPSGLPEDLRKQLIGTTVEIEGTLKGADSEVGDSVIGGTIARDVFEKDVDDEGSTIKKVRKTDAFTYRRKDPHTRVVAGTPGG